MNETIKLVEAVKDEIKDFLSDYKDFEYTGVIVTFATGDNPPYVEILMKHKKDGNKIKVKKLI